MKDNIFKFNPSSSFTEEQIKATDAYALMCKLDRGEKITIKELDPYFNELWHWDSYSMGIVKIMGWQLNFKPYFKRYVFRDRWDGWREVWAYNKTAVRKLSSSPLLIAEILEVPTKRKKI